jgi:hypothetical protein
MDFEEDKKHNIEKMGDALGGQYSELYRSTAQIHIIWGEYVDLFGTKPSRIELMNKAAPSFFRLIEDELWGGVMMHLSRLTDAPKSAGRANLTLRNLPSLVDASISEWIKGLVDEAVIATVFCRDWRNRRIAHADLNLALDLPAIPLADASRLQVNAALQAIAEPIRAINSHYFGSDLRFDLTVRTRGALSILYLLADGLKEKQAKRERFRSGKPSEDDFNFKEI